MFDDELANGWNKLFLCQRVRGLLTQEPAHNLTTHTHSLVMH